MAVQTKETIERNKEIVEKVNTGFTEGNIEVFLSSCADDVKWQIIGEKPLNGKGAIREFIETMNSEPPKFTVKDLIAEGDTVVTYGDMTMADKDGKTAPYSYCDIYRFGDDKIVELNSFVIKTGESEKV